MNPSLDEVIDFVREFTLTEREITAQTRIEEDLGVTGDDGADLLIAAEEHFRVALCDPEDGIRAVFGLGPNEYLFGPEGFDPIGLSVLVRWLRGEPKPVFRDLTVAELHEALAEAPLRATEGAA
jgi:hypothetical protein